MKKRDTTYHCGGVRVWALACVATAWHGRVQPRVVPWQPVGRPVGDLRVGITVVGTLLDQKNATGRHRGHQMLFFVCVTWRQNCAKKYINNVAAHTRDALFKKRALTIGLHASTERCRGSVVSAAFFRHGG